MLTLRSQRCKQSATGAGDELGNLRMRDVGEHGEEVRLRGVDEDGAADCEAEGHACELSCGVGFVSACF